MAPMTQEVVLEPMILNEVELAIPKESSSPRAVVQEPIVPLGEDILQENLNEETLPKESSLNEQQAGDVEMQSNEPTSEQANDELQNPVPLAKPTRAEPVEVEEDPQQVQQNVKIEVEVSPPKATSIYRGSRSSSRLPQSEGGPSSYGEPQRETTSAGELIESFSLPLAIRLPQSEEGPTPSALAFEGTDGSTASGCTLTSGSLREKRLKIAPLVDVARNMFLFGLRYFLAVVEEGNLEQTQAMRGNVNYIIQTGRFGGLDMGEFETSLEAIFAVINTKVETTNMGVKGIFESEVTTHKEEILTRLHNVEYQRSDHADILSSVQEAKVIAKVKVENVVHRMELAKVEAEFNELK